jgi:hypothetical protein
MARYDFSISEEKAEAKSINDTIKANSKRKGSRNFWKTMPILISTAIVVLTISLIWTDIRIADLLTLRFAADLIAFLLLFYMMFFTLQDSGNNNGKRDPEYVEVQTEYRKQRKDVRDEGAELDIPEFCEFYTKKELRDLRSRILLNANIRYDEWEREYEDLDELVLLVPLRSRKFERKLRDDTISSENIEKLRTIRKLSPRKKAAVIKACLLKPINVTPDMMMLDDGENVSRSPVAEKSIKRKQAQKDIFALCRITIMMICAISITGEFIVDTSISTLIFGLVKLVSLAVTGYRGYVTGFTMYTEYGVRRLNDQINLFAVFWKWRETVHGVPRTIKQTETEEVESAA